MVQEDRDIEDNRGIWRIHSAKKDEESACQDCACQEDEYVASLQWILVERD